MGGSIGCMAYPGRFPFLFVHSATAVAILQIMTEESQIHDVSDTALMIAAFRARESVRPDALFRDPLAEVLAGERGRAIAAAHPRAPVTAWMTAIRTVI